MTANYGSSTKMTFDTEAWDTNSEYDATTNYRYTPQTSGKYLFIFNLYCEGLTDAKAFQIKVHKNGSEVAADTGSLVLSGASDNLVASTSVVMEANGSTDYFEAYAYTNKAGGATVGAYGDHFFGMRIGA